ncbi:sensor histidine kinase [Rhodocytophaga rosea]|uniref:histidine kinase n=1 Tax=Rhodocytophaga rosea TaxID=2704465 RepID=A0A6C0GGK9_9BACT|nr:tetratricopeptide repeat-containing sensor histidine kinase [Rhodocytophaga rosea]QHT67171.1 sensor histidine kinase [Rhodocytophaga rosea]
MKLIRTLLRYISVLFFFFWIQVANGQKSKIDSLENVLRSTADDTLKVELLYKIVWQHSLSGGNPETANHYIDQLCSLSQTLNYPLGNAYCLDLRGVRARNISEYGEALSFHKKALKIAQDINNEKLKAITHNNIGVVYRRFNDYQNALYHHLEALKIAEKIQDKYNISTAVNSIGNIYFSMKEYSKALNYFAKGLEQAKEMQNSVGIAINLNNIGGVYESLGEYTKALTHYTESLTINQALGNTKGIAICFNDLGTVHLKMNNTALALKFYKAARNMNEKIGDKKYLSANYINLGLAYKANREYNQAYINLKKGLDMALHIGAKEEIQDAYASLSETYSLSGDYKMALFYNHKAAAYKDSLLNEHNQETIARMQSLFDIEQKEAQINLLETEKYIKEDQLRNQRILTIALVIGLVFILILFGIVYRNNHNRKQLNRILAYQNAAILHQKDTLDLKNQELTRLSEEKNDLMGVVAHDLRSPLSRIFGLANVMQLESDNLNSSQKEYIKLIGKTAGHLNEMIAKILDINAIDAKKINLEMQLVNVSRLLQETVNNFEEAASKKNIKFICHYAPGEHQAKLDWVYATQVLENLISNAIKFSPANKSVFISLQEVQDTIEIEIKDQGPGFVPEDMPKLFGRFQKLSAQPTAGEDSTGLGLSIVKKYMEAMQGEVACHSNPGQGASFTLTFRKALITISAMS